MANISYVNTVNQWSGTGDTRLQASPNYLRSFNTVENYMYLYHTDTLIVLPAYSDGLNDNMPVTYSENTPLSRSAPIFSYSHSGPRTLNFQFDLHRDMMNQLNYQQSNAELELNDDYVDFIIKAVQAAAIPAYDAAKKMVNPPLVAVKLGKDIFIKGIVQGAMQVNYNYPILRNEKYASVKIQFTVSEVEPYDAQTVIRVGSYRGLSTTLERNIYNLAR